MSALTGAERLAGRSRAVTLAGLAGLCLLAWLYLLSGAGMEPGAGMAMAAPLPLVAAMWWVMMVAMMVPSAAPAILLYGRVHRHSQSTPPPTAAFLTGYLIAWGGFSLAAAAAQVALVRSQLIGAMDLRATAPALAGAALIAAGLYQLSPWKNACLNACRSPAQFLARYWRPGSAGALRLGVLHGAVCVGCCWLLMILLFVGGVMNLAWVAALSVLVAVEKLASRGPRAARLAGVAMLVGGAGVLVGAGA